MSVQWHHLSNTSLRSTGGISPAVARQVRCATPSLLDELREMHWEDHPPHVKDLHCYAWKPVILNGLRKEFPHQVCCLQFSLVSVFTKTAASASLFYCISKCRIVSTSRFTCLVWSGRVWCGWTRASFSRGRGTTFWSAPLPPRRPRAACCQTKLRATCCSGRTRQLLSTSTSALVFGSECAHRNIA